MAEGGRKKKKHRGKEGALDNFIVDHGSTL